MSTKMISFHVPEDKDLLSALGVVTLRHEHLNHVLKMTVKSVSGITPTEASYALKYEGSRSLRQRINRLARKEIGEGKALLRLQAILGRAERVTEKRNQLIHGLWAKELDGDPGIMGISGGLRLLPTVKELEVLSNDIEEITQELNEARLDGFLKEVLDAKSKV